MPGTALWDHVTASAIAAVKDLSIDLTIVYRRDNCIDHLKAVEHAVTPIKNIDCIVLCHMKVILSIRINS